jgi:phosphoserine phosphatase RsbU/P
MASSPQTSLQSVRPSGTQWFVHDLIKLQKAAQNISSTLDLDELINRVVHEAANSFGCIETSVWLHDETTNEMVLASVCGCTVHSKGKRLKVGEQGMIGYVAATGMTRYAPDVHKDAHYIACEAGTCSELDIPLKVGGKVIGVFSAVHHEYDGFPEDQRRLLEALCGHIALAVQNARAFRFERQERERMQRDAREARSIQESLLPQSSPFLPGYALEAVSQPAGEVGGDWYDYIDLGGNRWGIVLADVSGKGTAAALLMSATRGILRSLAPTSSSPAEILSRLNHVLKDDFPCGRYVTMLYGILDAQQRTLTLSNAGHPLPVHIEGSAATLLDGESGLPLGLAESTYSDRVIDLTHGVKVLFYTDGISETENRAQEEFGTAKIREHMLQEGSSAASLIKAVSDYSATGKPSDDATVILLHCAHPA